jgi:formamidopyrimidine-DNA glycosylase
MMPELPEVETLCRQMSGVMIEAEIRRLDILDTKLGRGKNLKGRRVRTIIRQGKWIIIRLDDDNVIRLHLRMTGRLLWRASGVETLPHTRLTVTFDKGRLDLIDPRRFATLSFDELPDRSVSIGNPLEDFDAGAAVTMAAHRKLPVKSFLLDQAVIAGLGNIYVCEILHAAAIDPRRRTGSLSRKEWRKIVAATRDILSAAVACRGTSVSDWRDLFGQEGEYQNHLLVYGRTGKECPCCGGTVVRESLGGRGTFFCPACQQ